MKNMNFLAKEECHFLIGNYCRKEPDAKYVYLGEKI